MLKLAEMQLAENSACFVHACSDVTIICFFLSVYYE